MFVAQRHPGGGVPALVFVIVAAAVVAAVAASSASAGDIDPATPGGYAELASKLESLRRISALGTVWAAAIITVLALSLSLLELAETVFSGDVLTDFQRGHVLVSAFWGVVGLALLYVGLVRRARAVRVAGFVAFAVTVAKIFFYDLSSLSAMARALSFLGVGTLLLVAGFFYQRLSSGLEERQRGDARARRDGRASRQAAT